VTVTAEPRAGTEVEARALDLGESDRFDPRRPARPGADPGSRWRALVRGVAAELQEAGVPLPACRLAIRGDLPRGAGLSSSAALCVALALALRASAGVGPGDRVALARLCSCVENDWAGARTGLLDQLASLFGERGRAVRIDMRGPELEPVPLDLRDHRLATLDSGAARELGDSAYNERRRECAAASARLGVAALRDATADDAARLPEPLAGRVRHVTSENARVDAMVHALRRGDLLAAGRLLDASHASLRDDFEASVPAVERAVERAHTAGALGARMVGGGFGGHVLALFPPAAGLPADATPVAPGPGAAIC
ncbi:MAG: galactokinase, partial [Nocardioidaceae bacterium]